MSAAAEFLEWRRLSGLPPVIEDEFMTAFAQEKAYHRAMKGLKDGHDGPKPSPGWREGTGEAEPLWGWLTCCMEESAEYFGAGICIGWDSERYMVLVLKGGTGESLLEGGRRNNAPIHDTSHLTPDPPTVGGVYLFPAPMDPPFFRPWEKRD